MDKLQAIMTIKSYSQAKYSKGGMPLSYLSRHIGVRVG